LRETLGSLGVGLQRAREVDDVVDPSLRDLRVEAQARGIEGPLGRNNHLKGAEFRMKII
jgi:hypothetical protein